jgi:hypothetical protein
MQISRLTTTTLLLAGLLAAPATAQERTETVDRTLELPSNGRVHLKNFSGRIRITAHAGNEVVVHAVRRARQAQLDGITLDISTSGSTVTIDANRRNDDWEDRDNNVVNTEFEIRMPASATLDVNAFSSELTVDGVTGEQRLETFSGDITVTGARGMVDAESFNGDIDVDVRGAGNRPGLRAQTFSGDIEARLAADASGEVEFDTFSGSLDSDLPLTMRSTSRRRTLAALPGGASGERLNFETFSGSLRIIR